MLDAASETDDSYSGPYRSWPRPCARSSRSSSLATALREAGRVERTLFMIDWILDADLQCRAQIGLNKGETHHALKRAISFHRRGEIRDRSAEGQHDRIAGMNLLAAIIIFWNTMKLGEVVAGQTTGANGYRLICWPMYRPSDGSIST